MLDTHGAGTKTVVGPEVNVTSELTLLVPAAAATVQQYRLLNTATVEKNPNFSTLATLSCPPPPALVRAGVPQHRKTNPLRTGNGRKNRSLFLYPSEYDSCHREFRSTQDF